MKRLGIVRGALESSNRPGRASSPSPSKEASRRSVETPLRKRNAVLSAYAPEIQGKGLPSTPQVVPGGRFELPPVDAAVTAIESMKISNPDYEAKYYVVYDGHDHVDGVYTTWHDTPELVGAAGLVKGYPNSMFKAFSSLEVAENHYQEAKNTGVIDILKRDPQPNDVYIVTKGAKPGVYEKR